MRMHIIPHEDNKKGFKISQGWVAKIVILVTMHGLYHTIFTK